MIMKKIFLLVLMLSLVFVSCKKSQSNDTEIMIPVEENPIENISEDTTSEENEIVDDELDEDDEDDVEFDDSETDSTKDSEDWDALLDSYEQYVDKYISYIKKAAKGDVTALSEYPNLMENAQELGEKLQKAEGSMSSSQLSRYTRITNKMTQAIADMQ